MGGAALLQCWPVAVLVLLVLPGSGSLVGGSAGPQSRWHEPNTRGPYFDPTMENNVTTTVGRTVQLQCRIFQLGGQAVSWIRKEDLHILTLGEYSYTTDSRFKVLHEPGSHDFVLRVSGVQRRDAGVYECQVNTEPKVSWPVTLNVQVAQARIAGAVDRYVQLDSSINLSCELRAAVDPPIALSWLKDAAPLDLSAPGTGISLQTERTTRGSSSYLVIARARQQDSGNYSCRPSEGRPATVRVHVIDDEHPAAMQTAASSRVLLVSLLPHLLSTLVVIWTAGR